MPTRVRLTARAAPGAAGTLRPAECPDQRVDLRNRPATAAGHQGTRLAGHRDRDGVQTQRVGTAPLACRQFRPPCPLVRASATFENGVLVKRPDESTRGDTHAA